MNKFMRVAVGAVLVLALGMVGFVVCMRWSLRYMQVAFFAPADVDGLMARVELVRDVIVMGRSSHCPFAVDESSIGDKKKEAEMMYVAGVLDLYREKFGRAASSITDLNQLRDFDNASKLNGRQLEKDCSVYANPAGSYVVSCGPSRSSSAHAAAFVPRSDSVERFYELDGREILYVPARRC